MGLLDDAASAISGRQSQSHHHSSHSKGHHHKHRSRSRSRERSRHHSFAGSIFGGDSHHKHHNSSRSSFFGLGNTSRGSFFGMSRPSYYKRSPRPNFVSRAMRQLRRLLRDLVYYAKRHPVKVFMLVVAPLITGGFLTALLARFGLRLPAGLERVLGMAARASTGDSLGLVGEAVRMASGGLAGAAASSVRVERGRDGDTSWERRSYERDGYGYERDRSAGWGDGIMGMAKMFI